MIRFSFFLAALLCAGVLAEAAPGPVAPPDSIGVEYRNNTALIRHRVAPGETLYGLARRYKVPVDNIVEANPKIKGALLSGQIVLVPRTRVLLTPAASPAGKSTVTPRPATAAGATAAALALPRDARGNHIYVVKPGQTLFAIAQRFGVSSNTLLKQNRLGAGGKVLVGQKLIIVPAGGEAPVASKPAAPTRKAAPSSVPAPEPVEAVAATTPKPSASRPEPVRETPTPAREEPKPVAPRETPKETAKDDADDDKPEENRGPTRASEVVKRVTESGLAAVIPNANTVKYLALHKTAPVGSIVEVRNIMNNVSVFVRVIGPLPDTGENSNILIRLSPRAVQMLATPDQRFRVETSYLP
ncbi:LysM peptidoglycan-binding domain-containing protein [Hymenobacter sp. BT18]|uniref:LysM peptidoglycan-binding domain-containing protein n=1 Tax=Hymenobacter sp. BT18 TaxID=2835648 RepID=UPI00143E49B9|nr:LysM peptidoglycan-binding domain-containing protein [Hymenobacter sp. BT18]QIX60090.1 LysM peptidoglycan-binding domain-containing protein [Hymenobacter sp. BT18]